MEYDIIAGQNTVVGKLVVSNDMENIYVTYNITDPLVMINEIHLWIGNDLSTAPLNNEGVPVPGQFPYKITGLYTKSYTVTVPFASLGIIDVASYFGKNVYILAHSALNNKETAWSFGTSFSSWTGTERWGWYSTYKISSSQGILYPVYCFKTAFAKGNYVFSTDIKSNPENLPSLNLTKNRWGWAINLLQDGNYIFPIYAGAGLNNTNKGTLVGHLTVTVDLGLVSVDYDMLPGFKLEEIHLYAGDVKPVTLAPGRYGHNAFFTALSDSYSVACALTDTDGDGIWIIAHAVVGIPR